MQAHDSLLGFLSNEWSEWQKSEWGKRGIAGQRTFLVNWELFSHLLCISPARTFVMTLRVQFTSWCISGAPVQWRRWEKLPFLVTFQAEGQFQAESALQLRLRILRSGVERRMCLVSFRTMFENSFYSELLSACLLIGNSWPVSQLRLNKLMKQGDVTSWRTTKRQQVDQIVCWS